MREEYKGTDVTYKEKEYYINLDTVIFVGEPFYENSKGAENESTNRENYLLTADTYNIILNKRYKKQTKEGEPAQYGWRQSAFYPTIEKAFLGLLEKKIKDSDVATVNELIEEIRLAKSEIAAASFQYKLKGIQNEFITFL